MERYLSGENLNLGGISIVFAYSRPIEQPLPTRWRLPQPNEFSPPTAASRPRRQVLGAMGGLPWHFLLPFSVLCRQSPGANAKWVTNAWAHESNVIIATGNFRDSSHAPERKIIVCLDGPHMDFSQAIELSKPQSNFLCDEYRCATVGHDLELIALFPPLSLPTYPVQ